MPYRVLDNEEMNWADKVTDKNSYTKMIEAACNSMERDGYRLTHVLHGELDSYNPHTFIFYKAPEEEPSPEPNIY